MFQVTEAVGFAISPPAIPGIGTSGSFTFVLEDRAGKDLRFLAENVQTFIEAARNRYCYIPHSDPVLCRREFLAPGHHQQKR